MEAVSRALQVLGNFLIQKADDLGGTVGEVQLLKEELQLTQSFLRDATWKQAVSESVRNWISEIREVALDAEDAIEIFLRNVHKATSMRRERLRRCICLPNHVGEEERIISVRATLQAILSKGQMYGILQDVGEGSTTPRLEDRQQWFSLKKEDVVGLEEDASLVIEKLTNFEESHEEVLSIAITGMGGIGKTTLARKIYENHHIVYQFQLRAWVTFAIEFKLEDVIKQILRQLNRYLPDVEKDNDGNRIEMLIDKLHKNLYDTSYFIVLDDVWERAHWESLASILPRGHKASRCRLLITSRNKAVLGDAHYVHEMKPLNMNQSWELFVKKVFGHDSDVHCPNELENIGKRIVESCHGLPLTIIVVGGLLREWNISQRAWESFLGDIDSYLGNVESPLLPFLELSYRYLPPQLKPCFLCLPLFREDTPIPVKKLIQVWIAHDLIPQDEATTMEDRARDYIDELVSRNMVQTEDAAMDGRIKTIRVHDLIHKLSLNKAKEEINFEILRKEATSHASGNPRHRATYCSEESFLRLPTDQNDRLRSLIVHKIREEDAGINPPPSFWKSFKVLKVLDMEGCAVRKLPEEIGTLFWLRYLGLRHSYINELPQSMCKLENLQVIDSRGGYLKLAAFIWTMRSLRHLNSSEIWLSQPAQKCALENLQTLGDLVLEEDWMVEQLEQITGLTKLGVIVWSITESKLFTSLAKLENLVTLSLKSFFTLNLVGLGDLRRITKLKLEGYINELPNVGDFPPNLSYLSLKCSGLKVDPMPVLAELPNLLSLKLDDEAYRGEEIEIHDDGFHKLQRIFLRGLPNLKNINIWEMPALQKIFLQNLGNLSNIDVEEDLLPELLRWEIKECPNLNIAKLPRSAVTIIR